MDDPDGWARTTSESGTNPTPVDAIVSVQERSHGHRATSPTRGARATSPSPIEAINAGAIDGRSVAPRSELEKLFAALFKAVRAVANDKISPADRTKITSLLDTLTTADIGHAVEDITARAAQAYTALPDTTIRKVQPPVIGRHARMRLPP